MECHLSCEPPELKSQLGGVASPTRRLLVGHRGSWRGSSGRGSSGPWRASVPPSCCGDLAGAVCPGELAGKPQRVLGLEEAMPWRLHCEGRRHQMLGVGVTEAGGQPVDTRQFPALPPRKDPPYPRPWSGSLQPLGCWDPGSGASLPQLAARGPLSAPWVSVVPVVMSPLSLTVVCVSALSVFLSPLCLLYLFQTTAPVSLTFSAASQPQCP